MFCFPTFCGGFIVLSFSWVICGDLCVEKFTKSTLKEFLENHGKVLDSENEDKRLGMGPQESAIDVIKEYDLPLTPQQFFDEIIPIYKEK